MTPEEIKKICQQFYPIENLANLKEIGNRLILEFKDLTEDAEKTVKLKQTLATALPDKKISIVFVEDKNVNLGTNAIEKWQLPTIKKNYRGRLGQRRCRQVDYRRKPCFSLGARREKSGLGRCRHLWSVYSDNARI